jgi:hypothetical protein
MSKRKDKANPEWKLLAAIGAQYYATLLHHAGGDPRRLPPHLPIPLQWCYEAYQYVDGQTLDTELVGAFLSDAPENTYVSYYEDTQGQQYFFFYDPTTQDYDLRSNQNSVESTTLPPDAQTWFNLVLETAKQRYSHETNPTPAEETKTDTPSPESQPQTITPSGIIITGQA